MATHWDSQILFCPQCQSGWRLTSAPTLLLALLGACSSLTISNLSSNRRACLWYGMRSSFLTLYTSSCWLMTNYESQYMLRPLIPISIAIWRPKLSAWYFATLLEHNWVSVNEYGRMCFSEETETTPASTPSRLVAPSKCFYHEGRILMKNTSSHRKSSFSSQSSGMGWSFKKSISAYPFTALCVM